MSKTDGKPVQAGLLKKLTGTEAQECKNILKIFGSGGGDAEAIAEFDIGPTRVSFADAPLNEAWKKAAMENRWGYFEVKSEMPLTHRGVAQDHRFTERVVSGAEFDFSVSLRLLSDDEGPLFDYLLLGLKLLEMDALGGSGSRGYGRIAFSFDDEVVAKQFDVIRPF